MSVVFIWNEDLITTEFTMSLFPSTQGTFKVILPGETEVTTYTDYTEIPQEIDAVVSFNADGPGSGPHTVNDHAQLADIAEDFEEISARAVFKPATRIGDADVDHCSPMVRAVGSPNVFVNGIPWSRQTDVNTPHQLFGDPCPNHVAPIALGSPTVFVNGLGAGRVTDAIAGCTFVAEGSKNVFCGP